MLVDLIFAAIIAGGVLTMLALRRASIELRKRGGGKSLEEIQEEFDQAMIPVAANLRRLDTAATGSVSITAPAPPHSEATTNRTYLDFHPAGQ
jgi:hypothetical protein